MKETPGFIPKIQPLIFPLGMVAALFGSAGCLNLPFVWAYIAVFVVFNLIGHFAIDPSLRKERYQPGPNDRDRFLQQELEGYKEYVQKTPYRLFHGVR